MNEAVHDLQLGKQGRFNFAIKERTAYPYKKGEGKNTDEDRETLREIDFHSFT